MVVRSQIEFPPERFLLLLLLRPVLHPLSSPAHLERVRDLVLKLLWRHGATATIAIIRPWLAHHTAPGLRLRDWLDRALELVLAGCIKLLCAHE